jgi:hypothetical protein
MPDVTDRTQEAEMNQVVVLNEEQRMMVQQNESQDYLGS